jgi:hypothetical protein
VGSLPGFWPVEPVRLVYVFLRDSRSLLREPKQALGALAPIPERRVASSAFRWGEVGIEKRTLLVPLRPLGARHLTNH